jgi:hypothetical protein
MKKILLILILVLTAFTTFAQAPDKMTFQAVIRNTSNNLVVSAPIGMQVTIVQGSISGPAVYVESHSTTTNVNGLVTVEIGSGTVLSGNLSTIDWANGPYFIKTDTDPAGGTNYSITTISQLLSVPYALYAKEAGNIPTTISTFTNDAGYLTTEVDGSITNELQTLTRSNDTLFLSGDGFVVLPPEIDTDDQTLTINNDTLFIENGNNINLAGYLDNTDAQTLNLAGNTLSILNGNNVNLAGYLDNTDGQTLSLTANTLSISGGNGINLSSLHDTLSFIRDTDGNTKIQTEESVNENIIRFDLNGTEKWVMTGSRLEPKNTNNSIFVGINTGVSSTGARNLAIGNNALLTNTTAIDNLAIGYNVLASTTGQFNLGIGSFALDANTSGINNLAIGVNALGSNTTGHDHIAIGNDALALSTASIGSLAIGHSALAANTIGEHNTAIGYIAMDANTIGADNLAIGYSALGSNVSGAYNIALGNYTLDGNISGNENLAIGYNTLSTNNSSVNIAIGNGSLNDNTTGTNNMAIGWSAMGANVSGNSNIVIGNYAMDVASGTVTNNVVIGIDNMGSATGGSSCTSIGSQSLYFNNADYNTCVGFATLQQNTTGTNNAALGSQSMRDNVTGSNNVAIGYFALGFMPGGSSNTAVGSSSFTTSSNFSNSTALGYQTGISASNQVRIGNGSVTSIGGQVGWTTVSDARFKKNVNENVAGLNFIMKLRPVTYNLDANAIANFYGTPDSLRDFESESFKSAQIQTGFIAQEVEQAALQSGFNFSGVDAPKNENDFYGLRYAEFTVPLVKAVQEQQKIIEELQNTNTRLQLENEIMKTELLNIKSMLEQLNVEVSNKH